MNGRVVGKLSINGKGLLLVEGDLQTQARFFGIPGTESIPTAPITGAIGGVIGGPVGAAIGTTAGEIIDANIKLF
ncbi:TPA: hypothetical protein QCR55_005233 [Bacillus cereus]|jgi:hypothetical protein|uniref:hypothetical protein n=1 Tax=Bacillus TaxID=1386 RepID=UPI000352E12C|nr:MULTISPECIES: hypothetical protein [Bacillus]HDR4868748.1 hypothetical protein [Bacillus cereus]EPF08341.1 hypothetical protein ICA_05738 [Bacillus cereus BAG1O-3]MDR4415791.1 hypothetical protein [Bacillus thuringiensis]PFG72721.1 hypothetical protein DL97_5845 [Bacillus sp. YF23]HDR4880266.1 hypothetical protein [Bacillus cereus]